MDLCPQCLNNIINKLTPNDIYVLHELKDKTMAQTGESREEIFEHLKETMSYFQLAQAVMRLDLVGLIGKLKTGRFEHFHITQNGLSVLNRLSKE